MKAATVQLDPTISLGRLGRASLGRVSQEAKNGPLVPSPSWVGLSFIWINEKVSVIDGQGWSLKDGQMPRCVGSFMFTSNATSEFWGPEFEEGEPGGRQLLLLNRGRACGCRHSSACPEDSWL